MRNWPVLLLVPLGLVLFSVSKPAIADVMTFDVSFTADTLVTGSGADPAPADPVTGSFRLTFDPTVSVTNSTAGITLTSLNIALSSPLSYTYKTTSDGTHGPGTLRVGGLNAGSDVIIFNPSTDDFWLFISDFTGTAQFEQLGYTQSALSSNNLFFTLNQTGSVTVVPEPSAMGCLAVGAVAVVTVRRRRK